MTKGTEQLPTLWLFQARYYEIGPLEAAACNTHKAPNRTNLYPVDQPYTKVCLRPWRHTKDPVTQTFGHHTQLWRCMSSGPHARDRSVQSFVFEAC